MLEVYSQQAISLLVGRVSVAVLAPAAIGTLIWPDAVKREGEGRHGG